MAAPLTVPRVLWVALFASTIVYIAVLEVVSIQPQSDWQSLLPVFALGGLMAAGGSLLAPRFVRRKPGGAPSGQQNTYIVALILSLALAESVCILGLVLGFLGAPAMVVLPFFAVTWLLMLLRFPTQEKLDAFQA
jgi:hypothetical protein